MPKTLQLQDCDLKVVLRILSARLSDNPITRQSQILGRRPLLFTLLSLSKLQIQRLAQILTTAYGVAKEPSHADAA